MPTFDPNPETAPPSYQFRARRFQDIDLARIAREIGTAPYALVEWGGQSVVIAGEQAQRRGEAVQYVPTCGCGVLGVGIDLNGSPCGRRYPQPTGVYGWYDDHIRRLTALQTAAKWWAEVRRRERPDVTVTVTPATPAT